jgi:hypothetical protein
VQGPEFKAPYYQKEKEKRKNYSLPVNLSCEQSSSDFSKEMGTGRQAN